MMPRSEKEQKNGSEFVVRDGKLFRAGNKRAMQFEKKNDVLRTITAPANGNFTKPHLNAKRECRDSGTQTKLAGDDSASCVPQRAARLQAKEIPTFAVPEPAPIFESAFHALSARTNYQLKPYTREGSMALSNCVKAFLVKLIVQAQSVSHHNGRRRMITDDVDLALVLLRTPASMVCPNKASTSMSEHVFWGRKLVDPPPAAIDVNSADICRPSNERICDSIVIRDHWLCIEGVQPCLPENVVASNIKSTTQQDEAKRLLGIGGTQKAVDKSAEKRFTKQTVSLEHQVFYNEIVNAITSGTPLERQRTLRTLETDRGLQFLVGRFVILITEGVRVNIAARNINALANLVKLAWSIIKNPSVRLGRFLHMLVPAIFSCAVTKSLTTATMEPSEDVFGGATRSAASDDDAAAELLQQEYELRKTCGMLLAKLCDQFEPLRLRVRVVALLRGVFTVRSPPTTLYGALFTIFAMGYLPVKTIILPRLHDIYCNLHASSSGKGSRMGQLELRTVELMMEILQEFEACEGPEKERTESSLVDEYGEFGSMLFRYLTAMGRLKPNGELVVNPQGSWLSQSMLAGRGPRGDANDASSSSYSQRRDAVPQLSEDMLDHLLDESDHPWAAIANRVRNAESQPDAGGRTNESKLVATLVDEPKIVLVKKSEDGKVEYLRPLEPLKIPVRSASNAFERLDAISKPAPISTGHRSVSMRLSRAFSVDESQQASAPSASDVLKKFLLRPQEQAAAAVYGRALESSTAGRASIDQQIADAAFRLSLNRMPSAVVLQRLQLRGSTATPQRNRDEQALGRFLLPTDPTSRL